MEKMRFDILVVALVCGLLVGCGNKKNDGNAGGSPVAEIEVKEDAEPENVRQGEPVSAAEFVEYYGMERGEVPVDYLEGFIGHRQLTRDSLSERNYDVMVRELYDRGVTFGSSAAELIAGKRMEFLEEDDFSDVAYIVLQKDVYEDGTDMAYGQVSVLEVENQRVYAAGINMNDDYTVAEDVRELSEEETGECLSELRNIITGDWNTYHSIEGKEYGWMLHVVKEDGAVISFSGEGPDEEWHPGFVQWCEDYMK